MELYGSNLLVNFRGFKYGDRLGFRRLEKQEKPEEYYQPTNIVKPARTRLSGQRKCACGICENYTNGFLAPGHDTKAKSILNKALRGAFPTEKIPTVLIDYILSTPKWEDKYGHLFA